MRCFALAVSLLLGLSSLPARAESVVRYGISLADIPLTSGQPDRGAGAYQFTGYTLYDPLVAWEMDVADRPGKLVPGLATEWKVDAADPEEVGLHASQGRQVPRRQHVHRRCGDLEPGEGA